jgi:hypothetical protein
MDPVLKTVVRLAAGLAVVQGPLVADLTSVSVPAKIIAGIVAAIGLAGLLAEVVVDTGTNTTSTPTPKTPAA